MNYLKKKKELKSIVLNDSYDYDTLINLGMQEEYYNIRQKDWQRKPLPDVGRHTVNYRKQRIYIWQWKWYTQQKRRIAMVKELIHDPIILARKSTDATGKPAWVWPPI